MKLSILAGASLAVCAAAIIVPREAGAQSTPPSYPLYCQGPLTAKYASSPGSLVYTTTIQFTWSSQAASVTAPGKGTCAWADRAPRGTELGITQLYGSNVGLASLASVPAGEYVEYGVYRDPENRYMDVTQIVGSVSPPFSSNPSLPPTPPPGPPPK